MAHDNDELKIIPERDSLAPNRISPSSRSGNGLLWGFVIILAAGLGGLYFQNTQLSQTLNKQNIQLSQSLSRIKTLEDELTATGRDLSKSGATLENRIQTNESEIRKLWDLSNKRNRKDIDSNDKAISALKTQFSMVQSELKRLQQVLTDESTTRNIATQTLKTEQEFLNTKIGNQQIALTEQINAQQLALSQLTESEGMLREALKSALETRLNDLQQRTNTLSEQLSQLETQKAQNSNGDVDRTLKDHQNRLDSIDASRRQLISSVTRLSTDMTNLQLEVDALLRGGGD
ncbi:hypothetical protein SAMN02745127_02024 [Oceanospirillum multiglobuliferum]|uniref:Uncharacterized protein n=1 Tax=Oceanospirillum multiglobuliferum TaxID=64969 RepID=A0A1T4QWD1_9GAMM|nr:hypothetical protein [Oceanospirillum multiglobuliferum]OPX57106.1 hypothetical protein BTE48_01380 [Oceanospirillum multiglobuliferum]SKA07628.1 hypothetical protein SAMN02745127_02024 [Oceanospirillum multiglobuliferum]